MIQISLVIVGLCKIFTVSGGYSGGYLSYDFNNVLIGGHLNCNTSATISCKFAVNTPKITWKIAQTINDSSPIAAQCYLFYCIVNPEFLPNYNFTYNQSTGVTNITIKAVTFEHANLEFRCDDGSQPKPFKPSVAAPPEQHLTEVRNNTNDDYIELSINTPCIYPTDGVNITWYSKTMNGTNCKREHESKRTVRPCTTSSVCIMAKKSSRIESILHIPKHKDCQRRKRRSTGSVQERTFEVLVEHASGSFVIVVGNYSGFVQADDNSVNIHDINDTTGTAVFECNKCVVVRCYTDYLAIWQINKTWSTNVSLAAACVSPVCDVYNNFNGRYSFQINSSQGISDLTICPVSVEDNGMVYACNGGNKTLKALIKKPGTEAPETFLTGVIYGIPAFLLLSAIVAIVVCVLMRKRRNLHENEPTATKH